MPTEVPGKPFKYACDMLGNVHTAVFLRCFRPEICICGYVHMAVFPRWKPHQKKTKTVVRALTRDKSLSVSQMLYYRVARQSFWQSSEHLTIYI